MHLWAQDHLNETLKRFKSEITRVDVHMSEENAKGINPAHVRCLLQAALAKHEAVVASENAATVDEAFRGATQKLKHALDHVLGKLQDHRNRETIRHAPDLDAI